MVSLLPFKITAILCDRLDCQGTTSPRSHLKFYSEWAFELEPTHKEFTIENLKGDNKGKGGNEKYGRTEEERNSGKEGN